MTDAEPTSSFWMRTWRPSLVVAAVVAAYANSFGGMLTFDDLPNIFIPNVREPWPPGWMLSDTRPVTTATFAVNYAIHELDVWGYHAVNVGIHAAAALLLYGLVRRTLALPQYHERYGPTGANLALAAAVLWGVHPLNTQAVTYIVQRMESLMGMFYLLSLYALLRGATKTGKGRAGWYVLAVAASVLCQGSKQVGVTLPVVAFLYDRCFLAGSFRAALVRRWPVYLGLMASLGVLARSFLALAPSAGGESAGFGSTGLTVWDYARTQPGVILHYLRLVVVPRPLVLDYAWDVAHGPVEVLVPSVVVAALVIVSFLALWRSPGVGFLGSMFFLILAPTSSILPIADLAFEHRMYLSLACLVVLAVLAGEAVIRRLRIPLRIGGAVVVAVAVAFGALTVARNNDYRLDVRLWKDTIAKRPHNTRAVYNLGVLLFNIGEWDEAVPYLAAVDRLAAERMMIGVDPTRANNNLGTILARKGRLKEAADRYRAALRTEAGQPDVMLNLATVEADMGRVAEAERLYGDVAIAHPTNAKAWRGLAEMATRRGDHAAAADHYRKLAGIDPKANTALGIALRRLGQLEGAVAAQRAAKPADANDLCQLGLTLLLAGRPDEAAAAFRDATRLAPQEPLLRAHLALSLDDLGKPAEADAEYQSALGISTGWPAVATGAAWNLATHPDAAMRHGPESLLYAREADRATRHQNPETLDALAAAFAAVGRFPDAVAAARAAVAVAEGRGQTVLADQLRDRLKLYEAGKPYIQPGTGVSG